MNAKKAKLLRRHVREIASGLQDIPARALVPKGRPKFVGWLPEVRVPPMWGRLTRLRRAGGAWWTQALIYYGIYHPGQLVNTPRSIRAVYQKTKRSLK